MKLSYTTTEALQACSKAQETDMNWCGYWGTPPEYLFGTYIARKLASLVSRAKDRYFVELECDVLEAIQEGYNGSLKRKWRRFNNKKIDTVVSRMRSEEPELWATIGQEWLWRIQECWSKYRR